MHRKDSALFILQEHNPAGMDAAFLSAAALPRRGPHPAARAGCGCARTPVCARQSGRTRKRGRGRGRHGKVGSPDPGGVPSVTPDRPPSTTKPGLEACPALVLNADYQPLSYVPLSLWPWQEVVKAVFLDRVNIVATYDVGVRSPGTFFPLPSVVSLKRYQPPGRRAAAFTRFNVFLRDLFECQYCGRRMPTADLTFDHVVPRCRGGRTNWENVATACVRCNHAKGRFLVSEIPGLRLRRKPVEPTQFQLQNHARRFPPRNLHETWRDYVYWSQAMDSEENEGDGRDLMTERDDANNIKSLRKP